MQWLKLECIEAYFQTPVRQKIAKTQLHCTIGQYFQTFLQYNMITYSVYSPTTVPVLVVVAHMSAVHDNIKSTVKKILLASVR